jgi:flagellar hook-associated protein 2
MGSIGLSFGSPTSGQGFNVTDTVNQIIAQYQAVETPWKTSLTTLQSEDTALTTIGTDLASLSTSLQSLTDFQGTLAGKQGSSSDTNVLELTSASTAAVAGSHTVVVSRLAATASYSSDAVASASDVLTGSITLTVNGATRTINTDSGGDTLAAFANNINSAQAGVTASVINGSNGPELSIVSNTSGQAGNFSIAGTLTDTSNGNATIQVNHVGQTGVDANLTVDGIAVTSGSNTVSDAIPGVTFQLLDAASGTPVQVEITNDNSSVETAIGTLVTAYNKVIGDLNTQEGKDSSGNPEPLYGNPTLSLLQEQLQSALTFIQPAQAAGSTSTIAATDTLSGSLSIQVGSGAATSIAVPSGTPTLAGLAQAINTANLGVTATVTTSGGDATLSLTNATSGSAGTITVDSSSLTDSTTGAGVSFSTGQSNGVTSLTQLGLTVNSDGTIAINSDTLDSLLNSNYQGVVDFLQPGGIFTSFGDNFTTTLGNLGNSAPNGAVYLALQSDQTQENSLNTNISNEQLQIGNQQTVLTDELNQANYELQQIPSQITEINEIYSSITGYNQNKS